MPTFAFLLYGDLDAWSNTTDEELQQGWTAHEAFGKAVVEGGGKIVGGSALKHPSKAQTVRRPGLQYSAPDAAPALVTDGPFAEVKEVLGGFYLIEAASAEVAMAIAQQCPEPVIEVRPAMTGPGDA
jgi:hypothetical protein